MLMRFDGRWLLAIAALCGLATGASAQSQSVFVPLTPCRLADTRIGGGAIATNTQRTFNVVGSTANFVAQGGTAGGCGIPGFVGPGFPTVTAVALNFVAVSPTGMGNLRAFPSDTPRPTVSTLNFQFLIPPMNVANEVILAVRKDVQGNDITVYVSRQTDVVIDTTGYFVSSPVRGELNVTSPNVIGGYSGNVVTAGVSGATIGGGGALTDPYGLDTPSQNLVTDMNGTVAGGIANLAGNQTGTLLDAADATVGGGFANSALGAESTVSGGNANSAVGFGSTVPGGVLNQASGDYGLAAGFFATASTGSFVWSDHSRELEFASTADNSFRVRSAGGAQFVTATDTNGVATAGVTLATGGGSWASLSDRNAKTGIEQIDPRSVVERLARVPVQTWSYKTQPPTVRHIGPMAQDFHAAFGVGDDDRHINDLDASGVALAAVQGLHAMVEEKQVTIDAQQAELSAQKKRIDLLQRRLESLEAQVGAR